MPHAKTPTLLVTMVTLCLSAQASTVLAQPAMKVIVAESQLKTLPATIQLVGTVRPNRTTLIGSEVAGIVQKLPVRQGDYVRASEIICKLRDDSLALDLEAATKKLESLGAAVAIAAAELDRWRFEKQRIERLKAESKANDKEVADTEAGYLVALNAVQEAKQKVAEQQAIVKRRQNDLDKSAIVAPFSGYVTDLRTEVGQWMQVGGSVVQLIDLETVLVTVNAPESAIAYVQVADPASCHIEALEDAFEGTVRHIIPQADERARTFPVQVEIKNPQRRLRSGMFARVTLRSGPQTDTVAVPKDAVVQQDGINRVWMIQQTGADQPLAIPVIVTLGSEVDDWVAITSENIPPATPVVVRGNERLLPFPMNVQVVAEETLVDIPGMPDKGSKDKTETPGVMQSESKNPNANKG